MKTKIVSFSILLFLSVLLSSFNVKEERNLKVLPKDISDKHLDEIMDAYCTSLNVECGFCHTKNNMASDSVLDKNVARKMMVMTNDINEKYFGKNTGVISCMTCHNGKTNPSE